MKTELHPAKERGHAGFDWLDTYHSFSFASYFNPVREKFGCLRVLNDDTIAGGSGFDLHPHNNMEIITIMLEGALEHRDSMGNTQVINTGEVQVMSAGTGLYHAEYNHSETDLARLLQIWIFPRQKGLKPRYDQKLFDHNTKNELYTLVAPDTKPEDAALWIHQDAYISKINLLKDKSFDYKLRIPGNGIFIFIIEGSINAVSNELNRRDAIAITETESVFFQAVTDCEVLLLEIPMR
jgi:redox-sensitive bicupin YhaK (pirin superfamily)